MHRILALMILCYSAVAQDTVRSTTNGWLENAPALPFANDQVSAQAMGRVRNLGTISEDGLEFHRDLDGAYVVTLRAAAPEGSAVRLHFSDFHLPAGATVVVYGWNRENGVSRVTGPYHNTGPLNSGEFWTLAVPGSQAVIELQMAEPVATLPFRVDAIASLDGIEESAPASNPQNGPALTGRALFRGQAVEYRVVNGLAIFEGDIILGRPEELEPVGKEYQRSAVTLDTGTFRWPGGVVPYVIDSALQNPSRITDAIAHWNTNLAGYIKLVARTTEPYYIKFTAGDPGTCSSYVGYYHFAGQPIMFGDYCSTGNAIHEIGHALGLYHEHTRTDRDSFVKVNQTNIDPNYALNFAIANPSANPTPYDFGSIMHYPAYAFSINGQPTIETIPPGISIGQRGGLSAGDIAGIKIFYGPATPPPPAPVRITLSSNPAGRKLTVDGSTVTAPASFDWVPGSAHTVAAQNDAVTGSRYLFGSWSDGGAVSHTITTPSAATTYTANYQVQFQLLNTTSSTNGIMAISPLSADGFYPAGTNLTLSAVPNDSYCLSGWTGILPVTSLAVNLQLNSPLSVGVTFASGTITLSPWTVNTTAAGQTVNVGINTGSACVWSAGSRTSWITLLSAPSGTGSAVMRLKLDPNTTGRPRSGVVIVSQRAMIVRQTQ